MSNRYLEGNLGPITTDYAETNLRVTGQSPYAANPTDYKSWKFLAWAGPFFVLTFVVLFGLVAGNLPPFPADADPQAVWQHYADNRMRILIGLSLLLTTAVAYLPFSAAVAKVMERIEGPGGVWAHLERLGATITFAPPLVACVLWLGAAHEIRTIDPGTAHLLYWMGWFFVADRGGVHRIHAGQACEETRPGCRVLARLGHLRYVLRGAGGGVLHHRAAGVRRPAFLLGRVRLLVHLDQHPVRLHHQGHRPAQGRGRRRSKGKCLAIAFWSVPLTAQ